MNNAQCSICTENLDSPIDDVSAAQCGHVFHAGCLARWLAESSTCPQCRVKVTTKAVIPKLFFCLPDAHDASFVDGEHGAKAAAAELKRMSDDLANARSTLSERSRELAKLSAEKRALEQKSNQLAERLRTLESQHQKEVDNSKLLRLQLQTAQSLAREADEARDTVAILRRKVDSLQNVQTVINGFQDEIDAMIRDNADAAQLATWCTVLKSELGHKRKECRELSETLQQMKRSLETTRSTLSERNAELSAANSRVTDLESDIAEQNKQISSLRKKIDALQAALGSPSDTAAGFARRLINESPAPSNAFQTPKLSAPPDGSRVIDLDTSLDLFASPEPFSRAPVLPPKRTRPTVAAAAGSNLVVNPVRITSAGSAKAPPAAAATAPSREPQDISNRQVQFALDVIAKRGGVAVIGAKRPQSAVFREGYNGFGGHEKVVLPRPKSTSAVGSKKTAKKMFGPSKVSSATTDKSAPLPSLLSFFTNSADDLT